MINTISKYKSSIRSLAVMTTGILTIVIIVYLNSVYISIMLINNNSFIDTNVTSATILLLGVGLFRLFCSLVHNSLALENKVCLPKALRIPEAMALLHETVTNKKIQTINHSFLKIYKANYELGADPVENVDCMEVSGFHSCLFLNSEKIKLMGDARICCNYDDIQNIIKENKEKWCNDERLIISKLQNENKQSKEALIKATLRENELNEKEKSLFLKEAEINKATKENEAVQQALFIQKNEIDEQNKMITKERKSFTSQRSEVEKNLPIFLEAMRRLTQQDMPVSGFTTEHISNVIKASAQQLGTHSILSKHVQSFRKNLPAGWINQGGASKQEKCKPL